MTDRKFDLMAVLKNVGNEDYFATLTDEQQKAVAPLLIQRWLSGTSSARQIYLLNEVANPFIFTLHRHKELLWYLMSMCVDQPGQRYKWLSQKKSDNAKPISTKVIQDHYHYNARDALDAVRLLSVDQIIEIAYNLGYQETDITKIKKEHNASSDRKPSSPAAKGSKRTNSSV